jgi:hypothetical protein
MKLFMYSLSDVEKPIDFIDLFNKQTPFLTDFHSPIVFFTESLRNRTFATYLPTLFNNT